MPELPEVETVRLGLAPAMEGHVLTEVETRRGDLRVPFPKDFAARVQRPQGASACAVAPNISWPISTAARPW